VEQFDDLELVEELAAATGLEAVHGRHPHVKVPEGRVTQRLALRCADGGRVELRTWPAELVDQAVTFYGDPARGARLLAFCASSPWTMKPNGHLSYWQAPVDRRWYFAGGLRDAGEYLEGWNEDVDRVGGYDAATVEDELWPWLCERGYAGGEEDRRRMREFLDGARQQVHLRPGVELCFRWPAAEAGRGLRRAIREQVDAVLEVLGERRLTESRDRG
jgi:hypothetical protein